MLPYDLSKTARVTSILLVVYCLAELTLLVTNVQLFGFYDLVESGSLTNAELDQAAARVDAASLAAGGFFFVSLVACVIVSGMWVYRLAANANAVTPDENRITPAWSVGWFAVPFANLVMPYRMIRQHWHGLNGSDDLNGGLPGWVLFWWSMWLIGNVLSFVASRSLTNAQTIDQFRTASMLEIASSVVGIGAALLFRNLVLEMTPMSAAASPNIPSHEGENE